MYLFDRFNSGAHTGDAFRVLPLVLEQNPLCFHLGGKFASYFKRRATIIDDSLFRGDHFW